MFAPYLTLAVIAVVSYLLGSINTAILVSRIYAKDDVRRHGSGNAGMTNMLRTYGKGPAVLTACGDLLKSVLAVVLGRLLYRLTGAFLPLDAGYIAGIFVILGHLFPVFFHFKGGKGVITTLGVMLMVNPIAFIVISIVFIPLVFVTKIVSLSSVLGAVIYPVVTWLLHTVRGLEPLYDTLCAALMSIIVIIMHRENIVRLLNGTENKFGGKPKQ